MKIVEETDDSSLGIQAGRQPGRGRREPGDCLLVSLGLMLGRWTFSESRRFDGAS